MAATDEMNRLVDNIRIRVPGALLGVIQLELFNTLHEFLDNTSIWTDEDTITTTEGETEYDIFATGAVQIMRLLSVQDANLTPVAATMDTPGTIVLAIAPTAGTELTVKVVLSCIDPVDADGYPYVPDNLVQRYFNVLMDGVLGKLMSMIAKPYSNERMAIFHMRRFVSGMTAARIDVMRRNVADSQQWAFPRAFMPSGSQR